MIKQNLAILGVSGSIGQSSLKLLKDHPDLAQVELISAHSRCDLLLEAIAQVQPKYAFLTSSLPDATSIREAEKLGCTLSGDTEHLKDLLKSSSTLDTVLLGISGAAGLSYALLSLEAGRKLAIANKEPLVIAGGLFQKALQSEGQLIPVDSEHSAIFQCLEGQSEKEVEKIILTSSGGPFHFYTPEQFKSITPEQALKHPTWKMGNKITIDSATMMNKALELLEAYRLFHQPLDRIEVSVHRQSIVHSMVQFQDGSVMAQLGVTDMQFPILYALTYPDRYPSQLPRLDFQQGMQLSFEQVNPILNQALSLARSCGGDDVSPIILNAVNEVFVEAFMKGQVEFLEVYSLIDHLMTSKSQLEGEVNGLDDVLKIDAEARIRARESIQKTGSL